MSPAVAPIALVIALLSGVVGVGGALPRRPITFHCTAQMIAPPAARHPPWRDATGVIRRISRNTARTCPPILRHRRARTRRSARIGVEQLALVWRPRFRHLPSPPANCDTTGYFVARESASPATYRPLPPQWSPTWPSPVVGPRGPQGPCGMKGWSETRRRADHGSCQICGNPAAAIIALAHRRHVPGRAIATPFVNTPRTRRGAVGAWRARERCWRGWRAIERSPALATLACRPGSSSLDGRGRWWLCSDSRSSRRDRLVPARLRPRRPRRAPHGRAPERQARALPARRHPLRLARARRQDLAGWAVRAMV